MLEILRQLHEEHVNMTRVLNALEHQLAIFDRGEQPDYDVLFAAADYFAGFSDHRHHSKEELIFQRMKEIDAESTPSLPDLNREHQALAALTRHFQEAVNNVLEEVEVSRSAFDTVLRHFIREHRRHMQMEDERFLTLAERVLSAKDWTELDKVVTREDDSLFGTAANRDYQNLLDKILAWEREDEAQDP
jgi:hemerythrin-like domain-containing protein